MDHGVDAAETLVRRVKSSLNDADYADLERGFRAGFAELEDEMCSFGADKFGDSPDRVDALVWAPTALFTGVSRRERAL